MNKIGRELKYLSRRELVDIIYQLKKNEQELQQEIEALKEELADKRIRISSAGSIADAAMSVTNVFSAAQMTAELYLQEIDCMKEDAQKEYYKKIKAAKSKVDEILSDSERKFDALKAHYKKDYLKWKQLKAEIAMLEEKKDSEIREEVEND